MQTKDWFSALADETRLRCFRLLAAAGTPLSSPELVDILKKPLYTVSRSMTELKKAGLVLESRQGRIVLHSLAEDRAVRELSAWALEHCRCSGIPGVQNSDGSGPPGQEACSYDLERLMWRLRLRVEDKVVVTYPDTGQAALTKVLFVCVHNSARSQFAEEYLRQLGGNIFQAESAGLTPGTLNPYVVRVLKEEGLSIEDKQTLAVKDLYRQGRTYDWVITVCSREAEKDCPVFPGPVRRLNWPFEDPSAFQGTGEEILDAVRRLGQDIKARIQTFVDEQKKGAQQ